MMVHPDQSIPRNMDPIKINRLLLIGKGEFLRGRGRDIIAIAWVLS
jgi:hypothetical protein